MTTLLPPTPYRSKKYLKATSMTAKGWKFDSDSISIPPDTSPKQRLDVYFKHLSQELEARHGLHDDWHPSTTDLSSAVNVIVGDRREVATNTQGRFALCLSHEGKNYKLAPRAVSQLNKLLDVSQNSIKSILSARDETARMLLQGLYSRELRRRKLYDCLVRLRKNTQRVGGATDGVVRAILPKNFDRLDSLYWLRAFKSVLVRHAELLDGRIRLQCDGDRFWFHVFSARLMRDGCEESITAAGDEVIGGFVFRNSEIATNSFFFQAIMMPPEHTHERTTEYYRKILFRAEANIRAKTAYLDELPPLYLPREKQVSLNSVIETGFGPAPSDSIGMRSRYVQQVRTSTSKSLTSR